MCPDGLTCITCDRCVTLTSTSTTSFYPNLSPFGCTRMNVFTPFSIPTIVRVVNSRGFCCSIMTGLHLRPRRVFGRDPRRETDDERFYQVYSRRSGYILTAWTCLRKCLGVQKSHVRVGPATSRGEGVPLRLSSTCCREDEAPVLKFEVIDANKVDGRDRFAHHVFDVPLFIRVRV